MADLWVFGYGSLMWRPDFPHEEVAQARVAGWHRALCIYSWVHRGTKERPGLVLGLDRGGACRGVAYRVAAPDADAVVAYLRAREQATAVYREVTGRVHLGDGRSVTALFYVADRKHPQFAGDLSRPDLLRLVRQGVGVSGANPDYVLNTAAHLKALGIRDDTLAWLAERLGEPHDTAEPPLDIERT
jgi:cation transport protein ChaC